MHKGVFADVLYLWEDFQLFNHWNFLGHELKNLPFNISTLAKCLPNQVPVWDCWIMMKVSSLSPSMFKSLRQSPSGKWNSNSPESNHDMLVRSRRNRGNWYIWQWVEWTGKAMCSAHRCQAPDELSFVQLGVGNGQPPMSSIENTDQGTEERYPVKPKADWEEAP